MRLEDLLKDWGVSWLLSIQLPTQVHCQHFLIRRLLHPNRETTILPQSDCVHVQNIHFRTGQLFRITTVRFGRQFIHKKRLKTKQQFWGFSSQKVQQNNILVFKLKYNKKLSFEHINTIITQGKEAGEVENKECLGGLVFQ